MAAPDFLMNPSLDAKALAARFREDGRLHIADFLEAECAELFFQSLRGRDDWTLIINQDDKSFDLDRKAQAIYQHRSQRHQTPVTDSDSAEPWEQAVARNRATAALYDRLGLAEYEAIECFVRWQPTGRPPSSPAA